MDCDDNVMWKPLYLRKDAGVVDRAALEMR